MIWPTKSEGISSKIHMFAVLSSWICVKNPKNAGFFARKMTQWPVVPWAWNPEKSQPHPHWASRCKTAKPTQPLALWITGSCWIWLVVENSEEIPSGHLTLRTGSHGPFSSMIKLWSWSIAMFGSSSQIWAIVRKWIHESHHLETVWCCEIAAPIIRQPLAKGHLCSRPSIGFSKKRAS